MRRTIWERYLLKELLKVFFLFLCCFFFLYALIDYSLHMQDFVMGSQIQLSHLITYYTFQFIKRADLLIPLALMIATLKVLLSMNTQGELIALQASGVSKKQILRPFFLVGMLCALFNLLSSEFFLPSCLNHLDEFRQNHFKHSRHGNRKEPVHVLPLKGHSKIVYQTEDKEKQLYLDVFWIESAEEIWRMRSLCSNPENPVGHYVDHLKRNREGNFENIASFNVYNFTKFRFLNDPTGKGYIPLENRKFSQLLQMGLQPAKTTAYEYPQAITHLLFKTTLPLLSLIVIAGVSPFCLCYSRTLPLFFTYAIALFGFVTFFALMDAAVILAENLVLSPYLAILLPMALCILLFGYHYRKRIA